MADERRSRPGEPHFPADLPGSSPDNPSEYVTSEIEIEGNKIKTVARNVPHLPPWENPTSVGKRHPRVDAYEKVTGRAVYTTDLKLPRLLHGAILRSPLPNVQVVKLDLEVNLEDPLAVTQVVFGMPRLIFPEAGDYRLQAISGGSRLLEKRIILREAPPPPPPGEFSEFGEEGEEEPEEEREEEEQQ